MAVTLTRDQARNRRALQLKADCITYGAAERDVNRLSLEGLFELRWRLVNRMAAL